MDSQSQANCAEWCKSHYWQLQEKRGWRYQFRESTMVRYYEEANLDPTLLEPLVEFLKGDGWQACCTVHNKPIDATGWKTRDVWYETRDGDVKDTTKLKRTRIYHAFYKEGTQGADGPYTVEDGCAWKVTHKFYWRVAALPSVPQGESGVQWRMQGIARDDDTGLWSCVLEKRERVQQDVPEYATAKTVFEHRAEEQHLGVKQGQVASTGKPASVGGGVMVRRQIRKNEDCTSDVTNDTIREQPVPGAVTETTRLMRGTRTVTVNRNQPTKAALGQALSVRNEKTEGGLWNQTITTFARILGWFRRTCRKTIFLHDHAETVVTDQDPGFDHVESAGGGVIQEKTVTRNDEGGFDVETRTREEQNVPGAVVETRKFIDGVQVTTVNRGQPAAASASGLKIGESVRNEKTEGGLVDQTITQASVEPVGRTGEACEQNALVHTHSETQGMGTQPQQAEVTAPGAGQVRMRRTRLTERGAWEVTDETRTGKPAEAEAQGGSMGRRLEVRNLRNQSEITPQSPGVNEEVDVTVQRNEFGLVDGTVRKTTYEEMSAEFDGGAEKAKTHTTVTRNATDAAVSEQPQVNVTVDANVTPNDHGSFDKTVRRTTYEETSAEFDGGAEKAKTHTTVTRNATDAAVSEQPQVNVTVDASVTPNEHGSFDKTVRKTTYEEMSAEFDGGAAKAKTHTKVTRNATDATVAEQPEVNVTVDANVTPNEHGSFDKTVRKTEYKETMARATGGTALYSEERTVTDHTEDEADYEPRDGVIFDATATPNEHGTKRVTVTKRTATPKIQTLSWNDTEETSSRIVTYSNTLIVFRNQDAVPSLPSGVSVSPSVSINEFGLLDGVIRCRQFVSEEAKTGGGGSGSSGESTRVIERYKEAIVNKDGKPTGAKRTVVATETTYWSTDPMVAIRHFVNSEGGHGFKPRLFARGPYHMAITYKNINADADWVLGRALD